MFQKQPLRIKTPPYLKRAVCLSARNSCIKLLFIIIRNALEKFKKKKKKLQKQFFRRERPKFENRKYECAKNGTKQTNAPQFLC